MRGYGWGQAAGGLWFQQGAVELLAGKYAAWAGKAMPAGFSVHLTNIFLIQPLPR